MYNYAENTRCHRAHKIISSYLLALYSMYDWMVPTFYNCLLPESICCHIIFLHSICVTSYTALPAISRTDIDTLVGASIMPREDKQVHYHSSRRSKSPLIYIATASGIGERNTDVRYALVDEACLF